MLKCFSFISLPFSVLTANFDVEKKLKRTHGKLTGRDYYTRSCIVLFFVSGVCDKSIDYVPIYPGVYSPVKYYRISFEVCTGHRSLY
jgi:hypothetical protein